MAVSLAVTKRALSLGARNSTTGWRAATYTTSDAEMYIEPSGKAKKNLPPGYHASNDFIGITLDPFSVGDQVLDANSHYFLVENVTPNYVGNSLDHYIYDLSWLSEWEAVSGSTTWTLTRLEDPRHKTKDFIDVHCRVAQITKDDDSAVAAWAAMFSDPPYPLHLEFRHPTVAVQGLYAIERAQSKALKSTNLKAYGYVDDTITHVCTVDSTGCAGWALAWKMEHELRYAFENYPSGSLWQFNTAEMKHTSLGSMVMYDLPVHVTYQRLIT